MTYPSGVSVDMGNKLTPTQVKDEPTVSWSADSNEFYTLCMTGNVLIFVRYKYYNISIIKLNYSH